jgi:hypothetical protein
MKFVPATSILIFALMMSAGMYCCHAQATGGSVFPADYALLPIRSIELQLDNPVAYCELDSMRMDLRTMYRYQSGDFKHVSDAKSLNAGSIAVEGFKQVRKFHFYGGFSYDMEGNRMQKWKDVLMPSAGNPFILGDSIGGDYHNELFEIKAAVASAYRPNFLWGIGALYQGGNSSDQNDPRPKTDAVRYTLRPGMLYGFAHWKIGIDFAYKGYREEILISVLETNLTHRFFLFQGLGAYFQHSGISHSRRYNGRSYDGNLQLHWTDASVKNLLQSGYETVSEKSEDGSVGSPFKSGDYDENHYSLTDILTIKKSDDAETHLFKLHVDYSASKGTWYDQQQVVNSNSQTTWEVYNKSVKYKGKALTGRLEYRQIKEEQGIKAYAFGGSIDYEQSKTTLFPNLNRQDFTNLNVALTGGKTFPLPNRFHLTLDLDAAYRLNLTSDARFDGIQLRDLWSSPVYLYLTSDYYSGQGKITFSKRTMIGRSHTMLYLTSGISCLKATKKMDRPGSGRLNIQTVLGVTF